MPLLLSDRAITTSPLLLVASSEARGRHFALDENWYRVRSGVYTPRKEFAKLAPWQQYGVRVHAFVKMHPDQILCLESAAIFHGLPLFGETTDIHVFDPHRTSSRRFGDVCVHTSADPRRFELIEGIAVTSILDTVLDLTRVLPPAQAVAVVDAAISRVRGGMLDTGAILDLNDNQQSRRGSAQVRWAVENSDASAESPGESLSRMVIGWCGFETPVTQQTFCYEGVTDRADFYFERSRAIGESDGWAKYELEKNPKGAGFLLKKEKQREDRLRRHRHPFARWDMADVFLVTPLETALREASVRRIRTPEFRMLGTLQHRPREKKRGKPKAK